jgi:hypothetical protein
LKEQEDKLKAVMEEFRKPPARTPEQLMELIMQFVSRAAERGQSEVRSIAFQIPCVATAAEGSIPSLAEWESTLEGRPKLGYEFWRDHLRPLGFGLKAEVLEYPGGMPGDIGFILTW